MKRTQARVLGSYFGAVEAALSPVAVMSVVELSIVASLIEVNSEDWK